MRSTIASQGVRALCDAARERTALTLQSELGPLGIQVSHITVGQFVFSCPHLPRHSRCFPYSLTVPAYRPAPDQSCRNRLDRHLHQRGRELKHGQRSPLPRARLFTMGDRRTNMLQIDPKRHRNPVCLFFFSLFSSNSTLTECAYMQVSARLV